MDNNFNFRNLLRKTMYENDLARYNGYQKMTFQNIIHSYIDIFNLKDSDLSCNPKCYRQLPSSYFYCPDNFNGYIKNDWDCLNEEVVLKPYNYKHSSKNVCSNCEIHESGDMDRTQGSSLVSNNLNMFTPDSRELIGTPKERKTLTKISHWFPLFCDGVCRFLGKICKRKSSRIIVTGAVLNYNSHSKTVTTLECLYELIGEMDTCTMKDYIPNSNDLSLKPFSCLSEDDWLRNVVELSIIFRFHLKLKDNTLQQHHSLRSDISKFHESHSLFLLKSTKTTRVFLPKRLQQVTPVMSSPNQRHVIRNDLDAVLKICQASGDWNLPLELLLKKCGQDLTVLDSIAKTKVLFQQISVDIDSLNESLSYEKFSGGEKFNSTFTDLEEKLVFWAIMKDKTGKFLIKGFKVSSSDETQVALVGPLVITDMNRCGRSVVADRCHYELLGPMYKHAILQCYQDTKNEEYLDIFQNYFLRLIPTNWKDLISILHVICQCSHLSPVSKEIETCAYKKSASSDQAPETSFPLPTTGSVTLSSTDGDVSLLDTHFFKVPKALTLKKTRNTVGHRNIDISSKKPIVILNKICVDKISNISHGEKKNHCAISQKQRVDDADFISLIFSDSCSAEPIDKDMRHSKKNKNDSLKKYFLNWQLSTDSNVVQANGSVTPSTSDSPVSALSQDELNKMDDPLKRQKSETVQRNPTKRKNDGTLTKSHELQSPSGKSKSKSNPGVVTRSQPNVTENTAKRWRPVSGRRLSLPDKELPEFKLWLSVDNIKNSKKMDLEPFDELSENQLNLSTVSKTRSGRISLPPLDYRTGLSYSREGEQIFLKKYSTKLLELSDP